MLVRFGDKECTLGLLLKMLVRFGGKECWLGLVTKNAG